MLPSSYVFNRNCSLVLKHKAPKSQASGSYASRAMYFPHDVLGRG